jgi:sporulation protein YlmC with PRC-barrel domain
MRRVSVFLTTLVLAALLLAACGGQQTSTSVPSTNVPPVTVESTSTSEMTATEAPTASTDTTATPAIPVTGGSSPSRISNIIGSSVCGIGGDQIGTVKDLVLDFDQTMVTYVVVDANGPTAAVPWTSFNWLAFSNPGTGTGSGTGTGLEPSTPASGTGTGLETSTPEAGIGALDTSTPEPSAVATSTSTSGSGTGTGTGTGTTAGQSCLTLTVTNDMFTNAPAFDQSTLPGKGQSASGWDTILNDYWITGETSTSTPSASGSTSSTATPAASSATSSTAASPAGGAGTGTGFGEAGMQLQGVMLATDVLGATVVINPQGTGTGGTAAIATDTPAAGTGTLATDTPSAGGTGSTSTPSTGGSSSGTGTGSDENIVEDMIVDPLTGLMQYVVISMGTGSDWIPVPVSLLGWDSANSQLVLMVSADSLQNAPTFSSDQFPDTSMSGWDQEFSTFWQTNGGTGAGTGTGAVTVATATP